MSKILVLEQATVAAGQANWSLLNQYLQQLLLQENQTTESGDSEPNAGSKLLNWALEVLEAGDFQERWDVAKIFPSLGSEAIAPLIAILEDEEADSELRWFAGRILGEFDSPEVIVALVFVLKTSESEELSAMAALVLAHLGHSAIEALKQLLVEEESRLLAVRSLAQIRRAETIEPLLGVIGDPRSPVRSAAIEALSNFHDDRVTSVLVEALKDNAAAVRREAVIGLGLRSELLGELDLVKLLRDRLWDLNLEVCQQAAIALGRLGTESAAAALFELLKSSATPVPLQIELVRALGWIETSDAVEYLRQALVIQTQFISSSPVASPEIGEEIITVLGRLSQPAVTPVAAEILIDVLKSEHPLIHNPIVKRAIALGLGKLENLRAIEELIQMLADADAGVRLHAIAALKQLAPEAARQQLELLANNERLTPALKQGVAIALQEWPVE